MLTELSLGSFMSSACVLMRGETITGEIRSCVGVVGETFLTVEALPGGI